MNEHEKMVLIRLLMNEYNKVHEFELIDILNKIIKSNFIIEKINLNTVVLCGNGRTINVDYDVFEEISVLGCDVKISDNGLCITRDGKNDS